MQPHEYFTGDVVVGSQIDKEAWDKARSNCVIVTTDVMIIHGNNVFLGYRSSPPAGCWWIFGGRMYAGESFKSSAKRALGREFNLGKIEDGNLEQLGFYSLYWNQGSQKDHALLAAFSYQLPKDIAIKIPEGHQDAKWFSFNAVLEGDFHSCIKQVLKDYLKMVGDSLG